MATLDTIPIFDQSRLREMAVERPTPADTRKPIGELTDPRTVRKAERRRCLRLRREHDAAERIGRLPEPQEDIIIILDGRFHGFDVLAALLDLAGEGVTADEVWIGTLGFNRTQTNALAEMLDSGQIKTLRFVVSHMCTQKNQGEYEYLADTLTSRGQVIADTRNHAKLMLVKLSDGRAIVGHGSLNLRRCNSFEQLVITQDEHLFDFFSTFLQDVIDGKETT